MRILMVSNVFPPGFLGGYELGALDVARGLRARGHEVEVLTSDYFLDDAGRLDDIPVNRALECVFVNRSAVERDRLATLGGLIVRRNVRVLATEIVRFAPDHVLCFNLAGLGVLGLIGALQGTGIPATFFLMDNIFGELGVNDGDLIRFERVFGHRLRLPEARFVFMSRNLHREVQRCLGQRIPSAGYIPGWANTEGLPPMTASGPVTRFVFASRLVPQKGIGLVMEAAERLREAGCSRFTIDVYGGGDVRDLRQTIRARRLDEHVTYRGAPEKDEMLRRFADYDALLFPTWEREPFGFVVCEAAAAGCLPIVTDRIGAAEWYFNGVDCLKIPRTAHAVAAAMQLLVEMPRDQLWTLRARARSSTRRLLGFDRALSALEAIMADVPPQAPPNPARRVEAAMSILGELWRSNASV